MPCYSPVKAYRFGKFNAKTGNYELAFSRKDVTKMTGNPLIDFVTVPCGKCVGCRLGKSREWATRCVHENQMCGSSSYITLTFDNEHISEQLGYPNIFGLWSLKYEPFQKFMKRLRKRYSKLVPPIYDGDGKLLNGLKYFMCGEYGDLNQRPHYHLILFGFDFPDKYHWSTENGYKLYRSPLLEDLWPFGQSTIGTVEFESAAYVARYCMKKVNGEGKDDHYLGRMPEFTHMSTREALGKKWLLKYFTDVYPNDYVVIRDGIKVKPPKYYDKICNEYYPELMKEIKMQRILKAQDYEEENSTARLVVKEEVKKAAIKNLRRKL